MGIAKLYGQKASGININGIIKDYHAYAGENISAGDLVEYINGIAKSTTETSIECSISIQKAIELKNGNIFVAIGSSSDNLYGKILTISKTTITEGASFALTTSGKAIGTRDIVELSNGDVVVLYAHTSGWYYLYGVVCTVSGATISHGSEKQINTSSYSGSCAKALALQDDTILILHSYGSDRYVYRTYCIVSGTTITVDSSGQYLGKGLGDGTFQIEKMEDNKYVFVHGSSSATGYVYARAFTISGTSMSSGTDVALTSDKYSGSYGLSTCKLQNGDFVISHIYNTTNRYLKLLICSLSDLTISKRTDTTIFSEDYTGYYSVVKPVPNGSVLLFYARRINDLYYIYGAILTINNTTVTTGTSVQLSSNGYSSTSKEMYLLSNGCYLISYYAAYSRIIGVDSENNITLNIPFNEYETQVRKTTTSQFDGIAKEVVKTQKTVLKQGNIIPTTWTKVSTLEWVAENGTKITASGADRPVNCAVDGDLSTVWTYQREVNNNFLTLEFPQAIKIIKMKTYIKSSNGFSNAKIQGSNDNDTWVDLYTMTSPQTQLTEIQLTNIDYYKYYRVGIWVTSVNYASQVYELQTSEYEGLEPKETVSIYTLPVIVNLIKNGDFSNGLTNWTTSTGKSSFEEKDGQLVLTCNTSVDSGYVSNTITQTTNYISSHKYYWSFTGTIVNWVSGEGASASFSFAGNRALGSLNVSRLNVPQRVSGIYTNTITGDANCYPYNVAIKAGSVIKYDNIKLYDLTELFGTHNEPTKEWCDANL